MQGLDLVAVVSTGEKVLELVVQPSLGNWMILKTLRSRPPDLVSSPENKRHSTVCSYLNTISRLPT